jgi:uncharacterized membrane protein HdeD (DUF308 family)
MVNIFERRSFIMPRVSGWLMGILSIIAGILIIIMPSLLAWIVGIYLIVIGILAILAVVKR